MQYVKLDLGGRAYTYAWPFEDDPLQTGDIVRIPGNSVNPQEAQAKVIRILPGADWDGEITEILGRAPALASWVAMVAEDEDESPCSWCLEVDCLGGCLL